MAKSKLDRAIIAVLLLCVLVLIYLGVSAVAIFRKKQMPVCFNSMLDCMTAYSMLVQDFDENANVESNEYYRELIEKDLGLKFYLYSEDSLDGYVGKTHMVIRRITIDETANGYQYCWAFAHEALHLKHFIQHEEFVTFETFKFLYEHEELHNVGVALALKTLEGAYSGEYDVSDYIIYYLTNK